MYLRSEGNLGKVKRIRNNPAVQVAPCGRQGGPLACAIEARARLITDKREQRRAEKAIQRNYGLLRLIYRTFAPLMRVHPVYVAVTPREGGDTQLDSGKGAAVPVAGSSSRTLDPFSAEAEPGGTPSRTSSDRELI
jgi:hypothetical protein